MGRLCPARPLGFYGRGVKAPNNHGSHSLGVCGAVQTDNAASAGYLLANPDILQHMVDQFHVSRGHLGDRLIQRCRLASMPVEKPVTCIRLECKSSVTCHGPLRICVAIGMRTAPSLHCARAGKSIDHRLMTISSAPATHPHSAPSFAVPGDA